MDLISLAQIDRIKTKVAAKWVSEEMVKGGGMVGGISKYPGSAKHLVEL